MAAALTRPLAIPCEGVTLAATLHPGASATGLLIVTGGVQTRWGAHRGLRDLAAAVAAAGHPVLRFDRRGVGDSGGDDPGFRNSLPELIAARDALRAAGVKRIAGFGLCDGAAALALNARALALDAFVLANPWTRDADAPADTPPPAAIAARYRDRLRDPKAWARLLTGGVDLRKLAGGVRALAQGEAVSDTARAMADGIDTRALVLLSERDATAQAFRALWDAGLFGSAARLETIPGAGHSFARPADLAAVADACRRVLAGL